MPFSYPISQRLPLCTSSRPFCLGILSRCPPLFPRLDGTLPIPLSPCPVPLTPLQLPMPSSSTVSCSASVLSRRLTPRSPLSLPPLPPLGSYPLVQSLLTSWLFQPAGISLVSHTSGLYHAVSANVAGSIPFCLGLPGWKVGADENFPPLPRNTNRPCPSDNCPSRPPRYFEDGSMDPSNRGGGAFRGSGDRGLPSFGLYGRGAGRGRARGHAPSPAPFRPQFFDGDNRGRGRGAAHRDVPHETWRDANQSPFNVAIANMKKSLEDLPPYIMVDTWNDFLSWLKDYKCASC